MSHEIKPTSKGQDRADRLRPWVCPMCLKAGPVGKKFGRVRMSWLDWRSEKMRRSLVCLECAPRGHGPLQPDGLTARQREKKH